MLWRCIVNSPKVEKEETTNGQNIYRRLFRNELQPDRGTVVLVPGSKDDPSEDALFRRTCALEDFVAGVIFTWL